MFSYTIIPFDIFYLSLRINEEKYPKWPNSKQSNLLIDNLFSLQRDDCIYFTSLSKEAKKKLFNKYTFEYTEGNILNYLNEVFEDVINRLQSTINFLSKLYEFDKNLFEIHININKEMYDLLLIYLIRTYTNNNKELILKIHLESESSFTSPIVV